MKAKFRMQSPFFSGSYRWEFGVQKRTLRFWWRTVMMTHDEDLAKVYLQAGAGNAAVTYYDKKGCKVHKPGGGLHSLLWTAFIGGALAGVASTFLWLFAMRVYIDSL